ncbi:MAG: RluA family pseudouridine synthase [Burkholderiales bacterium]|jgi:tRNA pseudouridine32 synthase/23S rRNA pseudouridine746 synthase
MLNSGLGGELRLLYQDDLLLAVNKPSGLLSVPGKGPLLHGSVAEQVSQYFEEAKVIHRLDMATSGILMFARGLAAQRDLHRLFAQRQIHKEYVAVVAGLLDPAEGEIDAPLMPDWPQRPRQKVDFKQGKPSLTRYRVLSHDEPMKRTRVQLQPVTGRSHQLRVHLCWIGHPILGDALYAPPEVTRLAPRLLLHACRISMQRPDGQGPIDIQSLAPF